MSTAFRITQRTVSTTMLDGLQGSLGRLQQLQQQMSSGKQITVPSDSPVGTVAAMQLRGESRRTDQYSRNAQDGLGWLGEADSTLTSSLDMMQRARDLVLQGINASSDPAARQAIATEVDGLRAGLLNLANTTYLDRPIFAGTATGTVAYRDDGTYAGDGGTVARTVAPNTTVAVNLTGPAVFGPPGVDLFATLQTISTDLTTNPAALSTDLGALDGNLKTVQNQLSDIGARYNRIQTMQQHADDRKLDLTNSLSEVEDIDLPKTIVALQLQQVAYQAALGATAKVVQPSLVDFLR